MSTDDIVDTSLVPAETDKAEKPEMSQTEERTDSKQSAPRGSRDFSDEERAMIIAMTKELGVANVAHEIGVNAKLIHYWLHQEKKKTLEQPPKPASQTQSKDSKRKPGRKKEVVNETKHERIAEDIPIEPITSIELIKTNKPSDAEKAVSAESANSQEQSDERQALIIENAILKERVSSLQSEIEKLRAAINSLL